MFFRHYAQGRMFRTLRLSVRAIEVNNLILGWNFIRSSLETVVFVMVNVTRMLPERKKIAWRILVMEMRTAFLTALSIMLVSTTIWSFAGARRLDLAKLDLVQPFDTER